jgi:hypothetical protein
MGVIYPFFWLMIQFNSWPNVEEQKNQENFEASL